MKDLIANYTVVSGAGSWQEGACIRWHGYWQIFKQGSDGQLVFLERDRTPNEGLSQQDAAAVGRIRGIAYAEELAVRDQAETCFSLEFA